MNFKLISIIYWVFAIAYGFTVHLRPWPLSYLVKAVPAIALGVYALSKGRSSKAYWVLGFGFLASSLGDIFLDLSRSAYFIHALASFLVGHLCYSAFLFMGKDIRARWRLFALPVLTIGIGMSIFLAPKLGNLQVPVLGYITVIMVMGVAASLYKEGHIALPIGAVVFMCSDSLIALNKFHTPLSWALYGILPTYYLGHYLMAYGIFNKSDLSKN